ncbi:hypothetical protein OPKNFCMD_0612 [Methylobacterium crusticola]|uniref:Transcriptional regulator n=1 Tax=Methylobacterium crusticola TaxID=1697972 RepID=A0ABQ4QSN2_9HYPH|nr:hypothetical protein [Methylobacterium crusticola]GJD47900.1 hypothetical protein OPKNFCMD_0612 [Methylobacterium crusticola]
MVDGRPGLGGRPQVVRTPLLEDDAEGGAFTARRVRQIEDLLGVAIAPRRADGPAGAVTVEEETLELIRAFARIDDPHVRQELLALVQAAARGADAPG